MNTKALIIIISLIALGTSALLFPAGPSAVLIGGIVAAAVIVILSKQADDKEFLLKIFLTALILRVLLAIIINIYSLQEFFGPDALFYDYLGNSLSQYWQGLIPGTWGDVIKATDRTQSGWGMNYIIGSIYFAVGQNPLAAQFFCAVIGSATAPVTYLCAREIFSNKKVSRITGWIVALCPSLIIWSSQALKDGLIVFFLVLSVLTVIQLQKKLNYLSFALLMFALFGIISLRFYIFYMLIVAIVGCFAIGKPLNPVSVLRRAAVLLFLGLALSSVGATKEGDLSKFNLDKVQQTRNDLARGNAGFGRELDVSTTEGAITALPVGFSYLMLAPFPWQMTNLRQAITLPEMLLWWASLPFLGMGLWYTIKHRLRTSIAVLLFTMMLTIAYSLYQGNVGTAYRQRAQIQIFHFMFIAAGITLWQEKKENKKIARNLRRNVILSQTQSRKLPGYLTD
jgi:hypothetical protein